MKALVSYLRPRIKSLWFVSSAGCLRHCSSITGGGRGRGVGGGMLDINLFRVEKGNDPERIRESQRRRFASVEVVDEVIALDKAWRQRQFELDNLRKDFNKLTKEIARLKIVSYPILFPTKDWIQGFLWF